MSPPLEQFFMPGFGTEVIYSFIIIFCSLMVYFGTRELYDLTFHKGIKYFRQAFLFFAIAYFFRSIIKFILMFFNVGESFNSSWFIFRLLNLATLFLFMYFISMGVFYLLYSVMWKRWGGKKIYLFHMLAILMSIIVIFSREPIFLLALNLFLFILVSIIFYIAHKDSKNKKSKGLYVVYMLLFIFWILNIIETLTPSFLQGFQLILYLASSGIFLTILYKVLKKSGN